MSTKLEIPPREELLDALERLGSCRAVSYEYGVSPSTITRWKKIRKIRVEYRGARIPSFSSKEFCKQNNNLQIIKWKTKKGMRHCLKCGKLFYSEDLCSIKLCKKCKSSQSRMERVEYYQVATL